MIELKILVSCHEESFVPKNKYIFPIQVGTKNSKKHFENMLHDDEGENISEKNQRFCELTAQYWAWKNLDTEYYGFFHYRRYLSFNENKLKADVYKNVKYGAIDNKFIEEFCVQEDKIESFIGDYDLIVPEPMDFKKDPSLSKRNQNNYGHYRESLYHNIDDFDNVLSIVKRMYPNFAQYVDGYCKSRFGYFLNMYIMKKKIFHDYCSWLFPILEEFDKNKDYTNVSRYESRTPGLLSERLFGIYLMYLRAEKPELKIRETQQGFIADASEPYPKPAFEKNNKAICMTSSNEYVPFVGTVISSIIENSKESNNYDLFVISNGIVPMNKTVLLSLVAPHKNFSLRFIEGQRYLANRNLYELQVIDRSSYLRLAVTDFMINYEKAIYIDCDLVVNHDIAELYDTDVEGYMLAAARDSVQQGWNTNTKTSQYKYNVEVLQLKNMFDYFNAGVVVFNISEMNKVLKTDDLFTLAEKRNWMWLDQDILNMICQGRVQFLDPTWNVMTHQFDTFEAMPEFTASIENYATYQNARRNPKIIHYCGHAIPCYAPNGDLSNYFWKYARQTRFYEIILDRMVWETSHTAIRDFKINKSMKDRIRKLANIFLPVGTRRRECVKKIYNKVLHRNKGK